MLLSGCSEAKLDVNLDSLDVKPVESLYDDTEYVWEESADGGEEGDDIDNGSGGYGSSVADKELLQEDTEEETETEKKTEAGTEGTESVEDKDVSVPSEKKLNVTVLGNSVTCNEISDIWKSTWGMAATTESADYVHLVKGWLEGRGYDVSLTVAGIKNWEVSSNRAASVDALLAYVSKDTDIIIIQTGENITENKDTLPADYLDLFNKIRAKAPDAEALVLAEMLWPKQDIESAKIDACAKSGFTFLSMDEFLAGYDTGYKSAIGAAVKAQDGSDFTIENEVVAVHPNDAGMKKIAEIIEKYLEDRLK